ncbi:hypothetical protein DFR59_103416 [Falsibacillus pallidus]|uniref:Uncharacterized protein n=1 Tax=Falsibacillus pallidus TaxID=493781 RepID=A0A370GQV6_9BACI|nr:hypothetical protein DFR59_103416 [Falsibacillus pallidus]
MRFCGMHSKMTSGASAFLFVQLQRLAPRVISRTSTEIRISFEFRLMLVGADQGASAFLFVEKIISFSK